MRRIYRIVFTLIGAAASSCNTTTNHSASIKSIETSASEVFFYSNGCIVLHETIDTARERRWLNGLLREIPMKSLKWKRSRRTYAPQLLIKKANGLESLDVHEDFLISVFREGNGWGQLTARLPASLAVEKWANTLQKGSEVWDVEKK